VPAPGSLDLRAGRVDDVPEVPLSPARSGPTPSDRAARVAHLGARPVDTVFLDRDGTLNVKAPEGSYVRRPEQLTLLPGAAEAVAELNRAGLRTVLVTNQRWLAGPDARFADYTATHARLVQLLAQHGARLDAAYHCPHERGTCRCRKPGPGMLERAAVELGVDLGRSVIIGDAESDLAAGRAAGVGTVLIGGSAAPHRNADLVVPDLCRGVQRLLAPA
jgi:D-glycero-D-manno-heptose 1,7-bisphosphate phosphatase